MAIEFKSIKGYYYLDAWVIQLATFRFCTECLTPEIDPCHRLFDQMTMAARKRGANAGKQFWSCSSYPNCSATMKV